MKISAVTKKESVWRERVATLRASGQSVEAFAEGQPFAAATLRTWIRRLAPTDGPRFFRVVPAASKAVGSTEIVVEIGSARVRIGTGFDATLLAEVVRVLAGGLQ